MGTIYIYTYKCDGCCREKRFYSEYERNNYKCPCQEEKQLLTIELQDETSDPKVFYRGKEVKYKVNVSFDWDTSDEDSPGGLSYTIENYEKQGKNLVLNSIERRLNDHM